MQYRKRILPALVKVENTARPLIPASTAKVVDAGLAETVGDPGDSLFAGPRGERLSRDDISRIVSRHAKVAVKSGLIGSVIWGHGGRLRDPDMVNLGR